jgi:acyl CoA:acetate/3-ketoacid CoA transferase beta subunit
MILTDLAVMDVTPRGLKLRERAPGVSVADIQAQTEPTLLVEGDVPEIRLASS